MVLGDFIEYFEYVRIVFNWLFDNYVPIIIVTHFMIGLGVIITRLTPTKTDDGFFKMLDDWMNGVMDLIRIPNVRRGDRYRGGYNKNEDSE
jgi:hypothetical protein